MVLNLVKKNLKYKLVVKMRLFKLKFSQYQLFKRKIMILLCRNLNNNKRRHFSPLRVLIISTHNDIFKIFRVPNLKIFDTMNI